MPPDVYHYRVSLTDGSSLDVHGSMIHQAPDRVQIVNERGVSIVNTTLQDIQTLELDEGPGQRFDMKPWLLVMARKSDQTL